MIKTLETSELLKVLRSYKRTFVFVGLFSFFINLLMLVPPLYMLQIYDRVLSSRSVDTLMMLTLIVIVLFITLGGLEFIRSRILVRLGNRLESQLSARVFDAEFALANKYPGSASNQALSDLMNMRQFMTGNGVFAFFDAPWLPIYIFVLYLFHPLFALFAIVTTIILIAITLLNEFTTSKRLEEANNMHQQSMRFVNHNLKNHEVIQAMGMLGNIRKNWFDRQMRFLTTQSDASDNAGKWSNLSSIFRKASQSLILGLGGYLAINAEISAGMMIAGSIIMGRALAPMDLLINSWKGFTLAKQGYTRLNTLLEEFPEQTEPMSLPNPKGEIEMESLVVVPPQSTQPSLKGVSMRIEIGDIIGVVGPSAAGKSTLARAVLGIWPLHRGKVRIDGAELDQWDRERLGMSVGYLPQDIELFEGTISENIERFGEHDPEVVVKAAQKAGVHEIILHLPDGYNTMIGPGGLTLSGGQRQRIGLARALYGDPVFVVLDEPNSNLDEFGEKALLEAIIKLKQEGTTVMLITHRTNILSVTDKIAVLALGELKLYGPRDEILAKLMGNSRSSQQRPDQKSDRHPSSSPDYSTNISLRTKGHS